MHSMLAREREPSRRELLSKHVHMRISDMTGYSGGRHQLVNEPASYWSVDLAYATHLQSVRMRIGTTKQLQCLQTSLLGADSCTYHTTLRLAQDRDARKASGTLQTISECIWTTAGDYALKLQLAALQTRVHLHIELHNEAQGESTPSEEN
jgi:hypothetical protein